MFETATGIGTVLDLQPDDEAIIYVFQQSKSE